MPSLRYIKYVLANRIYFKFEFEPRRLSSTTEWSLTAGYVLAQRVVGVWKFLLEDQDIVILQNEIRTTTIYC